MAEESSKKSRKKDEISKVSKEIRGAVDAWIQLRGGIPCYPLLIDYRSIDAGLVG